MKLGIMGTLNQLEMVETGNGPVTILVMIDRTPGQSDVMGDWTDTRRGEVVYDGKKKVWFIPWLSTPMAPVSNPDVPGSRS